ncbi:EGF-like repeat and discoidin I-like domain-containing protein 3 [Diadema antillarum]|uniref:EGF-like repeat and discoidin I-like domain-containing protein 3 n=1 Tax=Diadema antillarum TaxID=105358 RepID=UPI003A88D26B
MVTDLEWAETRHCAQLGCRNASLYAGDVLDVSLANVIGSSENATYPLDNAFLSNVDSAFYDYETLLSMDFGKSAPGFSGWCAEWDDDFQPFIQVQFQSLVTLHRFVVLGAQGGRGKVTSFHVAYTDPKQTNRWRYYRHYRSDFPLEFSFDDNAADYLQVDLNPSIEAEWISFLPTVWLKSVCMRIFLFGSTYEGGLIALGMESEDIRDVQIYASSSFDENHRPHHARLHGNSAWCAAPDDANPWLEMDLLSKAFLDHIAVQGRSNGSLQTPPGGSYLTKYKLSYSVDRQKYYAATVRSTSLVNADDVEVRQLSFNIVARYFRLSRFESIDSYFCLRVELYGYMNFATVLVVSWINDDADSLQLT